MIGKNKQSPATLYLLNTKNANKIEQQRKSARVTFGKKKSSRSISQHQKWNASKDNNNGQFQPSNRTNSQIKKIVLSKNQYSMESMPIQRKLCSIIQIFNNKKRLISLPEFIQNEQDNRKSQQNQNGQLSSMSIIYPNPKQRQKQSKSRRISHLRIQSMLNHSQYQNGIQLVLTQFQRKFKQYEKLSQDWKLNYTSGENDHLLDDLVRMFKSMLNQLNSQYSNEIMSNLQYFQDSLTSVTKQHEIQITSLKQELSKADNANNIIINLMKTLNQKHCKGVTCTKVFQDIQKNGINLQQLIRSSSTYGQMIRISQRQRETSQKLITNLQNNQTTLTTQKAAYSISDDDESYQQQKLDHVKNDSNWNNHYQNRQSIKETSKLINNHNQNKQISNRVISAKGNRINVKIDNWKSFQNSQYSGGKCRKIMSQR